MTDEKKAVSTEEARPLPELTLIQELNLESTRNLVAELHELNLHQHDVTGTRCAAAISKALHLYASHVTQKLQEENARLHKNHREKDTIIRHWQDFVARIAKKLKCLGTDEDVEKAIDGMRADNAKLREEKDKLEKEVRESLWYHGHDHLYGDDGEMQCSQCREWDYKRGDLNVLREQAFKARMENVAKAFNWKERAETAERQLSEAQEALRKIAELTDCSDNVWIARQTEIKRIAAIGKEGQLGATEEGDKGK